MFNRNNATLEQIVSLWGSGIIGKIEARNWIAWEYPGFKQSRRKDVDDYLEQLGESKEENQGEENV